MQQQLRWKWKRINKKLTAQNESITETDTVTVV
jgi:hypothetical protein